VLNAGGVLDRIVAAKAVRLQAAKAKTPYDVLMQRARATASRVGTSLGEALKRTDRVNIIAEIKQRSPSKGIICEDFDPVRIAESYVSGGAAALSVLCEEDFFGGSLKHLKEVRSRVAAPLLRKDFIFDPYQVYESRAAGADAVLLIVALLDDELLARLIEVANELGLDALVEVHCADEMSRAESAGASIVGVNNRDLTSFKVDLDTSIQLAPLAPTVSVLVSESGITTVADIRRLRAAGFQAFLIGEHLMRAQHPRAALKQLIETAEA
jgi:indole-3-glycerol phosphate synthase